jgi:choloylglycine hydrolase
MSRLGKFALQTTLSLVALSASLDILACTGVRIKTQDNAVVYGRSMEFAQDLHSKIMTIPKGLKYTGMGETGVSNGKKWDVKYPMAGTSAFNLPYIVDGMNTEGLAVGIFYFPNYAKYIEPTKANAAKRIGPWELPTYLLSQYATVEEVKKGLESVDVVGVGLIKDMPTLDLHYVVHDATGKSLVIEYIDGKLKTYDNPIGVITNSPAFDWHITNLSNYINLTVNNVPPMDIAGIQFKGIGQGTGLLGLPGDFTPPSRFIRAVAFSQTYLPAATGAEGVFDVFHILNQFDIPKGAVRGKEANGTTTVEYTQWTSAANLSGKKYYYHTYYHRDVGMIDLMKMDPNAKKIQFFPMDKSVNPPEGIF